jgi:hypothetical protein
MIKITVETDFIENNTIRTAKHVLKVDEYLENMTDGHNLSSGMNDLFAKALLPITTKEK